MGQGNIEMSIKQWYEEECSVCGSYHNEHYICLSCMIAHAVRAGASLDKLLAALRSEGVEPSEFELQEAKEAG